MLCACYKTLYANHMFRQNGTDRTKKREMILRLLLGWIAYFIIVVRLVYCDHHKLQLGAKAWIFIHSILFTFFGRGILFAEE